MFNRLLVAGLALTALAGSTLADTMKFIETKAGRNVKISLDHGSSYNSVFGGVLNMKYIGSSGSVVLDGFCADATVSMASGYFEVTKTTSAVRGQKGLFAGYLVNNHAQAIFTGGNSSQNRDKAMALQVALWEILTETSGTYNINAGKFRAKAAEGSFTTNQINLINSYLGTYGQSAAEYYKAAVNQHGKPCSQSIITVPEPGTMAALAIGIGAVLRRRIRKS